MSSKYSKKPAKKEDKSLALQVSDFILNMSAAWWFIFLLVIYPLFYDNKYFNIGQVKYEFFKYTSYVFMATTFIGFLFWIAAHYTDESFNKIIRRFSKTDWFVAAYWLLTFFSFCACSGAGFGTVPFWGFTGWYMGFLSQSVFVIIYFAISRSFKWNPLLFGLALISGGIVYFLAIAQRFGIDILNMYEKLAPEHIEKFVSTLGQTTWYSSYAMLILPVGIFWYMKDKRFVPWLLSGLFVILGAMSICTVNSDSAYIALVLELLVFFWYAFDSNESMFSFLEVVLLIMGGFIGVGAVYKLFPERELVHVADSAAIGDFVSKSMFSVCLTLALLALYIILRMIVKRSYNDKTKRSDFDISKYKIVRVITVIAAVAVLVMVVAIIILNTNHMLPASMSAISNVGFFNFNDQWGNYRGFNWRVAWKAFTSGSIKDTFIGVGPDCFVFAMEKYCKTEVDVFWRGIKLVCAHNEWLNTLVTGGILGLISYLGIFISLFARLAKNASKEPASIMIMAAIIAYIGHNFFCYQQCLCTPIIFLLMGVGEMMIRVQKDAN